MLKRFTDKLKSSSIRANAKFPFELERKLTELHLNFAFDHAADKGFLEIYFGLGNMFATDGSSQEKVEHERAKLAIPSDLKELNNADEILEELRIFVADHEVFLTEVKRKLGNNEVVTKLFEKLMRENGLGETIDYIMSIQGEQPDETNDASHELLLLKKSKFEYNGNLRTVSPSVSEHEKLRQKMTPGEKKVFDFFDKNLAPEWEIYIQPHLNGLRPDFVLLNPNVGIAVFEVKDWNLDAMEYKAKEIGSGKYEFWAKKKGGTEFCLEWANPIAKVIHYKQSIYNIYCPRLDEKLGLAAIQAGVIFPLAKKQVLDEIFKQMIPQAEEKYLTISGVEQINEGDIKKVLPSSQFKFSKIMSENCAKDLRGWLVEPDFAKTQRTPLELDARQKELANSRTTSGFRRIKGPAGSGKSLVLAARAANLANEGKSALVVTFNITLMNYLRDLVRRAIDDPNKMRNVVFRHFHGCCRETCIQAGMEIGAEDDYGDGDLYFVKTLPELAMEATSRLGVQRYDAILVDEGQDYLPLWWEVLRKCCKDDGEMLLVADATQDIYDTSKSWTDDAMKGAGFSGAWSQLETSYRLPNNSIILATDFAKRYLPDETVNFPNPAQGSLDIYPTRMRWYQCQPEESTDRCVEAILELMQVTGRNGLANADITFLSQSMRSGKDVINKLHDKKIHFVDTFGEDHRRKKIGFFMGDAKLKATTLHSFKGWESRLIVVQVEIAHHQSDLALIYAALTRLKRHVEGSWLTIVCSAPELTSYGETWPKSQVEISLDL